MPWFGLLSRGVFSFLSPLQGVVREEGGFFHGIGLEEGLRKGIRGVGRVVNDWFFVGNALIHF